MRHLRLPKRHQFRRDVYVGYADADWRLACVTLPRCLQQRHGVRLLLRDREELPGSVRAETIVDHIDDSWKVKKERERQKGVENRAEGERGVVWCGMYVCV